MTVRAIILRMVDRENIGGIRRIRLAFIWQRQGDKGNRIYYIIKKSCNNTERQNLFSLLFEKNIIGGLPYYEIRIWGK
jgi:hypothetical protein